VTRPTRGNVVTRAFIDSNVLVYAFTTDRRAARARQLLQEQPTISVQSLNEFSNVTRRKFGKDWKWLAEALAAIRVFCPSILPITLQTHDAALRVAERHNYAIFDALIVASALEAGSDTLWSEDMQHGMKIDGRLRIANPFRTEN
jgi:predicted nucleic acid-binding protein